MDRKNVETFFFIVLKSSKMSTHFFFFRVTKNVWEVKIHIFHQIDQKMVKKLSAPKFSFVRLFITPLGCGTTMSRLNLSASFISGVNDIYKNVVGPIEQKFSEE